MIFDPALPSDPRILRAYEYWDGLRHGRELPSRADIQPESIKDILPFVLLVDVIREPLDFRIRLAGTDVVSRFGEEITGKRLSEIDLDGKYFTIFDEYKLTFDRRRPALFTERFCRNDGRFVSYSRLLCPLSSDGGDVDKLFGVQVADSRGLIEEGTGIRHL